MLINVAKMGWTCIWDGKDIDGIMVTIGYLKINF
jgi:hypothetical protein